MLRPLRFAVGATPISSADVEQARSRAARLVAVNGWLWLPVLALAIRLGWLAGEWMLGYLQATQPEVVFNAMPATVFGFAVVGMLASGFNAWSRHWRDEVERLAPLDAAQAETALALVARHPELDAWRRAIVQQREIVNAEFTEMQQFHDAAMERERAAAIQSRQEAARRRLHIVNVESK